MEYRIFRHSGDKFEVQRKAHWWSCWRSRNQYDGTSKWLKKYYPNIESAKAFVKQQQPHMKPVVVS